MPEPDWDRTESISQSNLSISTLFRANSDNLGPDPSSPLSSPPPGFEYNTTSPLQFQQDVPQHIDSATTSNLGSKKRRIPTSQREESPESDFIYENRPGKIQRTFRSRRTEVRDIPGNRASMIVTELGKIPIPRPFVTFLKPTDPLDSVQAEATNHLPIQFPLSDCHTLQSIFELANLQNIKSKLPYQDMIYVSWEGLKPGEDRPASESERKEDCQWTRIKSEIESANHQNITIRLAEQSDFKEPS
jgi:hypothetical protein